MCNRARLSHEHESLFDATGWLPEKPRDNRCDPVELQPKGRAYVIRQQDVARGIDVMESQVLGGGAAWTMTNVRKLSLPQWKRLAECSKISAKARSRRGSFNPRRFAN